MSASTTVAPTPLSVGPEGAAELTGITARTLRRWRSEGYGPRYVTLGGNKIVYRVADLDAWLVAVQRAGDVRAVPAVVR